MSVSFRSVFIAITVSAALIVTALIVNGRRPAVEVQQPTAQLVEASGKCAECHARETSAIVIEYRRSHHALKGVTCLDCHRAVKGQRSIEHRGFTIADTVTPANCASCHAAEYAQFERSRHAAPAWAALYGSAPFTAEQIAYAEQYQPGAVKRAPNALVGPEGPTAISVGCATCHAVGKPHADGSIGSCTVCHSRHAASVALARLPTTCGQCHMGPDHSQLEIYSESKHGVLFALRRNQLNLDADPKHLTTMDMSVPTCATCHMSGLGGMNVTHDVTERLSWYLFQAVSTKRPDFEQARAHMQQVCGNCHASPQIKSFYAQGDSVVAATNTMVAASIALMDSLKAEGLLTAAPFDQPIDFVAFDLWHFYGRTAKHGAFMGGADFTQWHGNYELVVKSVELRQMAEELRAAHRRR